jgi:hypothetical protein
MDEEHEQAAEDRGASVAGFSGRVGPQQLVDRTDYLRLLQQAMRKLGYNAVADRLKQESVSFCHPAHISHALSFCATTQGNP